jgi:hypothetical protein
MKMKRKISSYIAGIFLSAMILSGCGEEPWNLNDGGEILANLSAPANTVFFFQETESISYEITISEPGTANVTSVIVNKQLFTTEGNSPVSTFEISGNTISQTEEELFADVPVDGEVLTENDLTPGDYWLFSYELVLDNGRTVEPGGRTRVTFTCPSEIGGEFSYSTSNIIAEFGNAGNCNQPVTGTGALESAGPGIYNLSDATFGQYGCAWDDSPAVGVVWTDVCNTISVSGSDSYGLVYTFNVVSNDGTNLVIDWANDYGDSGRTTLTREGGWPLDLEFN